MESIERHELKFLIPVEWIPRIEAFIAPYCALDDPSAETADHYYFVNTLYLDSPVFTLLKNRMDDVPDRFTLRIRAYGEPARPPYFFEVKRKVEGFVRKTRARWQGEDWARFLTEPVADGAPKGLGHFSSLMQLYRAEPKVLTQYRRKAYVSVVDRYARVTFDRDLRRHPTSQPTLVGDDRLHHYDHEALFPEGCNVILEVKCIADVPLWILDLIQHFDLRRSSFSKFASSVLARTSTPDLLTFEPHSF